MTPAPALPAPFSWRDGQITGALPGGQVLFTTAAPGAAGIPIDLARWNDSRSGAGPLDALAAEVGLPAARLAQSHQVHEQQVRAITGEADLDAPPSDYDAQVTDLRDVACVVRVADCLPVALIASEAVGVAHAGWRGLAAGVLRETVEVMRARGAGEVQAAIGPGARVCCYEAGDEVHAAFADVGEQARQGANADLVAVATTLLERAGVSRVHDTGICTICADRGLLWSYRREGTAAGRQAGVAWRS